MYPDGLVLILLSCGCTISATQIPKEGEHFTEAVIIEKLSNPRVIVYFSLLAIIAVLRGKYLIFL
jgi:hypothetical protein